MLREAGTEAMTGGIEEWIQEGMQLGFTELALQNEGLESILPKNADGSVDTGAILEQMNEAFKAGFVLEGLFGAGMIAKSAKSRVQMAAQIGGYKKRIAEMAFQIDSDRKIFIT